MVGGGVSDEQNRNYYRKLLLATRKFAEQMEELGYDEKRYESLIKEFYFLDEIYYDKKRKERPEKKIGVLRNLSGVSLKGCLSLYTPYSSSISLRVITSSLTFCVDGRNKK